MNTDPATISLEMCVKQACLNLKSTDERSINRGDGQYVTILHAKDEQKSGYLLHITTETPGEAASVGRPKAVDTKLSTTIRIDRDVLSAFKKGGPGWQTRINAALRDWTSARSAQPKRRQAK